MSALKSVAKIIKNGPDIERHRRRMRYYTWLVDVFRLDGSVMSRIIGPVLTVTLWATFVAVMVEKYGHQWRLTNNASSFSACSGERLVLTYYSGRTLALGRRGSHSRV
ncbi:hypothetical protein FRC12_018686 [Ceratobasidium sp. 428]|nr:hypothetical protein FRC12_018686 [Ceratobasidium sp. 428]